MGRYRVLAGKHVEPNAEGVEQSYKTGDVVDSSRPLTQLFQNKFEKLADTAPPEVRKRKKAEEEAAAEEGEDTEKDPTEAGAEDAPGMPASKDNVHDNVKATLGSKASKLGENVTDEFPKAGEAGLLVLKKGKQYFIADPDDADVPMGEALDKKGVNKELSKQLKG